MPDGEQPISETWRSVLTILESDDTITPMLYGFLNLVEPKGIAAGTFYLEVPNEFTASMLNQRMRVPLLTAMGQLNESVAVSTFYVVVNPELEQESLRPVQEPVHQPDIETPASPQSVFESARTGAPARHPVERQVQLRQLRHRPVQPVRPRRGRGRGRGPGQGVQPTLHLRFLRTGQDPPPARHRPLRDEPVPRASACATSAREEFTNDFINSIANNRGSAFQNRYRNIDILMIDDIQFLQGKAETQEAFFHTFNTLHDHNKQVVITSDLPPKALTGFEDRMRSRFEWGLITDVQAPDLETRIAILRKKAQSEKLQVPHDILEFMASKVSSNIRELEGTLIRVTAFASLNRTPVDMDLVQTVLKDVITLDEDNVIAPVDIITNTADYFKLTVDDLYGSSRSQAVATARQIAMYLCRELTNLSLPKIGQLFGNRDHTTVMYANKKISELMKERRSIYNQVTELTNRIKQDHRYK